MTTVTTAKVILDSLHSNGVDRLTTLECTFPRFILAEVNTHRAFSRNSASSRAIPVAKQIARVRDDPFVPKSWPANRAGMQADEDLNGIDAQSARAGWLQARDDVIFQVEALMNVGVHKQIANRLLEPFMWHTAIISSTEWENFYRQRCSPLAQPQFQELAYAMRDAIQASEPTQLRYGEWHLPYVFDNDRRDVTYPGDLCVISAARCARVSYLTHDGVRDISKDIDLGRKLMEADPPHASPLEHVARPTVAFNEPMMPRGNFGPCWIQFRHEVGM